MSIDAHSYENNGNIFNGYQDNTFFASLAQASFLWRGSERIVEVPIYFVGRETSDPFIREQIDKYTPQFNGDVRARSKTLGLMIATPKQYIGMLNSLNAPTEGFIRARTAVGGLPDQLPFTVGNIAVKPPVGGDNDYYVKAYPTIDTAYGIWEENDIIRERGFGLPPLPAKAYHVPGITLAIAKKRRAANRLHGIFMRSGLLGHTLDLQTAKVLPATRITSS